MIYFKPVKRLPINDRIFFPRYNSLRTSLYERFLLLPLLFVLLCFNSKAQVVFSETFSTSLGQCSSTNSVSGAWVFGNACTSSSLTGHSAPGHAIFQGSGCQFGNGGNTVSGNLSTPTIAIGSSGAVLTFNYLLVTECGTNNFTCNYDRLTLQISNNGGTSFTDIMSSGGTPSGLFHNSSWTAVSYNLNAYSNQTIIIRFNFNSIDGIGNNYDGVYVDDIVVTLNCSINLTSIPTSSSSSVFICSGNSLTLTTNAVSNYSWSNGATSPSIVVSPTNTTSYSIVATSSANCVSSASLNVQVNGSIPTLSVANTASANSGSCPNSTVVLTATGANTYSWSGGSSPIINGAPFTPTTAATYVVVGANACGTSSAATSLSIHTVPTVTAIASTSSLCSGTSLTLTGLGTATNYAWSGAPFAITNGVGFNPSSTATYTVIGTSALSCTASANIPVTVVTTPILAPTAAPGLICIGKSSTLTATGATNYTWTSATQTVNTATFVVTPGVGISTYTVVKSNANCVDTKVISVITNSLPTIFAIVNPNLVCALKPATLAVGGAQTYTWTSPAPFSFTFTGASPVINPPASGIYSVAASDGTCINTTTVAMAVDPNPTLVISGSTPSLCAGQSVSLSVNGGNNYTWTATSNTSTLFTPSISDSPNQTAAYTVVGDNSFGCVSSNNTVIIVYNNPTITVAVSRTLVCSAGPSTLTASGANSYTWDPNAGGVLTPATIVNPVNVTSGPVVYTVQGKFNSTGCQSTRTVQVSVFVPTLTVSGNTNTCDGGLINLTASGGNNGSYIWNTGSGSPYTFPTISTTLNAPAVFTVSALTTSLIASNCPSSKTVSLGIYYNPTITAVPSRTFFCRNEVLNLTGNGGVSYVWSNNVAATTITVSPNTNTNYTVTGTDINGCSSTGTIQVRVSGCTGIDELSGKNNGIVIYPNPNNGEFTLSTGSDIILSLVNELGQLIRMIELSGANQHTVSFNGLAKGIYFVSGQKDNVQVYQKIVVTK